MRRFLLRHENNCIGLKLPWLGRLWMIRYFGDKTHKIREDLIGFGTTWIDMIWNLGRGLKATWIVNNSSCGSFLKKIIPYCVHTRHKWHSSIIWSRTEHFEILAFQIRGSGFQLSHQDHELILEKHYHV